MNTPLTAQPMRDFATRRQIVGAGLVSLGSTVLPGRGFAQAQCTAVEADGDAAACLARVSTTRDEWIESHLSGRPFGPPLSVSRFRDRVYYLNRNFEWKPQDIAAAGVGEVVVAPKGFVTDFASIPRVFWAVLAPDDDYLMAAVIHDWLYWHQPVSRETADRVMRLAMQELRVVEWQVAAIHRALRWFGESAWTENARLKAAGENRVLCRIPEDASVRWADWKTQGACSAKP